MRQAVLMKCLARYYKYMPYLVSDWETYESIFLYSLSSVRCIFCRLIIQVTERFIYLPKDTVRIETKNLRLGDPVLPARALCFLARMG